MRTKEQQGVYLEAESKELNILGKARIESIKKYDLLDLLLTPKSIETLSDLDLKTLYELAAKNMFICGDVEGKFGVVALTIKIDGEEPNKPKVKLTREGMLSDINGILQAKREAGNNLSYTNISDAKLSQISMDEERFSARVGNFQTDIAKEVDLLQKYHKVAKEAKQLSKKMREYKKLFTIKKYVCDIIDAMVNSSDKDLPSLYDDLGKERTEQLKEKLELQKETIKKMSSVQLNEFKVIVGNQLKSNVEIDLDLALDNSRKEVFKKIVMQELKELPTIKNSMKKYVEAVIAATKFHDKDLAIKEISRLNENMANQYSYLDPLENAKRAKTSAKAIINEAGEEKYGQLRYHIGQTVKWIFGKSDAQQVDQIFEEVFPARKKLSITQIIADTAVSVKDSLGTLKPSFVSQISFKGNEKKKER